MSEKKSSKTTIGTTLPVKAKLKIIAKKNHRSMAGQIEYWCEMANNQTETSPAK